MFSIRGVKEGCGLYGIEHLVLFILTITIIFIVLHFTKRFNHNQVQKVLKITCILLWILEIIKIVFVLQCLHHYIFLNFGQFVFQDK